ncbi:type I restriction enzyme, S subunit [Nitrosomonas sp. Nm166]|nr:type I restriction enzyme, S subunit [Nitrosomonas sp. Nm166]
MAKRGGSINPAKLPNEVFDLFSIPAFDRGEVEVLAGSEIGSSKSCIEINDVLLSKIIPHIRRCWVVPEKRGRRQIGSGEWIIFRSDKFYPNYLRHYLTSDNFHRQFMNTTAGMGGSLVRARPAAVEKIKIPLPPLKEQKRIAAILDKADAIRRKRQQAIALTDQLLRSIFLDMFGDPVTNPKGWEIKPVEDLIPFLFHK